MGGGRPCSTASVPQLVRLACMGLRFNPETSVSPSAIGESHFQLQGIIARLQRGDFWVRSSLTYLKLKMAPLHPILPLPYFSPLNLPPPGILLIFLFFPCSLLSPLAEIELFCSVPRTAPGIQ